jgi:hypothetical protein
MGKMIREGLWLLAEVALFFLLALALATVALGRPPQAPMPPQAPAAPKQARVDGERHPSDPSWYWAQKWNCWYRPRRQALSSATNWRQVGDIPAPYALRTGDFLPTYGRQFGDTPTAYGAYRSAYVPRPIFGARFANCGPSG